MITKTIMENLLLKVINWDCKRLILQKLQDNWNIKRWSKIFEISEVVIQTVANEDKRSKSHTLLCKQSSSSEATLLARRRTLLHTSSKYSKNGDKRRSVKQSSSSSKQSCFRGRTLLEFACIKMSNIISKLPYKITSDHIIRAQEYLNKNWATKITI